MNESEWLASNDPVAMAKVLPKGDYPQWRWFKGNVMRACGWSESKILKSTNTETPLGDVLCWISQATPLSPTGVEPAASLKADWLRCIFGNPFADIPQRYRHRFTTPDGLEYEYRYPKLVTWLSWRNGTIPKLAAKIHDDRDFALMPYLADALEEAGCAEELLLRHLREDRHCHGCHVLELLRVKEASRG